MAILMQIQDAAVEASLVIRVSGGYNPDVLDDIQRRLLGSYKEIIQQRLALRLIDEQLEGETEEPLSGLDAPIE
jgi:hypothetical protein